MIFESKRLLLPQFLVLAIVSFGEVSRTQKEEAKNQCVSLFSWNEFSLMVSVYNQTRIKETSIICKRLDL